MFGGSGGGDPSGYLGPASIDKVVPAATDPDDDDEDDREEAEDEERGKKASLFMGGMWENPEGVAGVEGAFSALTPSMWPDSLRLKEDQVGYEWLGEVLEVTVDEAFGPLAKKRLFAKSFFGCFCGIALFINLQRADLGTGCYFLVS